MYLSYPSYLIYPSYPRTRVPAYLRTRVPSIPAAAR